MLPHRFEATLDRFLSSPTANCLLLVEGKIAALCTQARTLQERYAWPQLQVGPKLSEVLLNVAPRQRPRRVRRQLVDLLSEYAPGPVLCTHIDLLFTPVLQLDPLMLFRHLGKTTSLVICWPGEYHDDVLSYAVPEHAHYRTWRHPNALIVTLD